MSRKTRYPKASPKNTMKIKNLANVIRKNEVSDLCSRLIKIRSDAETGEEKIVAYLRALLEKKGFKCRTYWKQRKRPNLIASVGKGPEIAICCHLDTVPAGKGWHSNPYSGKISKGYIYGRGAADNKGQATSAISAVQKLMNSKDWDDISKKARITLVLLADEETGSELGMKFLIDKGHLKPDIAIVPDIGGNMKVISIAEKGAFFVRVMAKGVQAHGSIPESGENAIDKLILFINQLKVIQKKEGTCGSMKRVTKDAKKLFTKPSCNIGVIRGGDAVNMVAANAEVELDFRYLPGQQSRQIMGMIKRAIRNSAKKRDVKVFEIRVMAHSKPAFYGDKGDVKKIGKLISGVVKGVVGVSPRIVGLSGSTVGKFLFEKGIPVVCIGCGDNKVMHSANEKISIDELVDFANILSQSLELIICDVLT